MHSQGRGDEARRVLQTSDLNREERRVDERRHVSRRGSLVTGAFAAVRAGESPRERGESRSNLG
jgi:hypothetical protein